MHLQYTQNVTWQVVFVKHSACAFILVVVYFYHYVCIFVLDFYFSFTLIRGTILFRKRVTHDCMNYLNKRRGSSFKYWENYRTICAVGFLPCSFFTKGDVQCMCLFPLEVGIGFIHTSTKYTNHKLWLLWHFQYRLFSKGF